MSSRSRRLPAYGRELLRLRESGRVPDGVVVIGVGLWLQDQLPPAHCLVVPDDVPLSLFNFTILAGLGATIVHDIKRLERACDLVNCILAIGPVWLAIMNLERRIAATVFELGATCVWPWGRWEWARFDGEQPLRLPESP